MECTQRIECTQDISFIAPSNKSCAQQVGFLGISGVKYPLNKGPNKIGRDPKTCTIVLDENTISRQHAVINIMNEKNFVLMDLESSNRTKLMGVTIQPYTPHALKNGDAVQFGDVLGIFRLLVDEEEVDDLPLTQAAEIPATPVNIRHVSRANAQIKTIPETPDGSYRDDSIIDQSPSRSIGSRNSNNNSLIRSPASIGTNKNIKVYRNTSKKSDSFSRHFESHLEDNESDVSSKTVSATQNNIYDLETQPPNAVECVSTNVYDAKTQPDTPNKVTLPKVFKVQDQNNVQLNLYSTNKKDVNIHELDTQKILDDKGESTSKAKDPEPLDDEDLTDFEDDMIELSANKTEKNIVNNKDDDDTDCEDDIIEISQNRSRVNDTFHNPEPVDNYEDLPTQVIGAAEEEDVSKPDNVEDPLEDILTQVIPECPSNNNVDETRKENDSPTLFEDIQTQVIETVKIKEPKKASPSALFKVPNSPLRLKRREISPTKNVSNSTPIPLKETACENNDENDENYYVNTQAVFEDLCSQSIIDGYDLQPTDDTNKLSIDSLGTGNSSETSDGNEKIQSFVSNLSKDQVRDVIGVEVVPLTKKKSSDSSDLETTPKKFNPSTFLTIDLPNSQDIKSCKFVSTKVNETDFSDGFEGTEDQDDMNTSDASRGKKLCNIKQDLSKKFDINTLPTRAITRIRKTTTKLLDSDDTSRKKSEKILQSKLGLDNKIEIDSEVIAFNLARLRNKAEKEKNKKSRKISTESPIKRESDVNEKVLKQQSIASMMRAESKKIKLLDAAEVNTKPNDSSTRKRRGSRSNVKIEETVSKVEKVNPKTRGSKKTNSRENIVETWDLTDDEPLIPRRSKRNRTHNKIEDKVEKTRKSRKNKETSKADEANTTSHRSSNDTKSRNNKHSLNISSEKAAETSTNSGRENTMHTSKTYSSTEKSRSSKPKNQRTRIDKKSSTSRSNKSTNREETKPSGNPEVSGSHLKRSSSSDLMHPSKRKKVSEEPPKTRTGRGIKVHYIVMTAFMSDPVVEKLQSLGAVMVPDVKSCTVVLTKELKRTCKLLCAVGLGKPIVGLDWVQACSNANMIVDPWLYLIKDEAMERRLKFNLQQSITCSRNFLREHKVSCTPHAKPCGDELKEIVECSGGTFGEGGDKWLCLSCPADELLWPALRRRGARMIDTETFLTSIMRQKLDVGLRSSSSKPRTYQRNTGVSH